MCIVGLFKRIEMVEFSVYRGYVKTVYSELFSVSNQEGFVW